MKLSAFTVENYRSIRQSHRLVFGDSITTLIGPNNEGKSNIIRALISSLNGLSRYSLLNGRITQEGRARLSAPNIPSNRSPNRFYWERDFPISIQDEQPDAVTRFVLEFDPSLAERRRLQSLIGSAVQGSITFELKCGVSEWHLVVRDAAATSNILPKHIRSMCRIVSQAISPQYIPSVRTAESAQEIVRSIVRRELAALESKK